MLILPDLQLPKYNWVARLEQQSQCQKNIDADLREMNIKFENCLFRR